MSTEWDFAGQALYNTGTSAGWFLCPVSLPHGATVNKVVLYYYDNSLSNNLTGDLWRIVLDGAFDGSMAFAASAGAQPTSRYMEDTSISYPTIDLQSYSYVLLISLPPDTNVRLLSYRIDYQYGASLPAVMKNSN